MVKMFVLFSLVMIQTVWGQPKILVGVAGGTGCGKTTFAEKIQAVFPDNSVLISQDSYYKDHSHLSIDERRKVNFDHPDSLDFEMLKIHLNDLMNGLSIDLPIYNFHTHSREKEKIHIDSTQIIIVEGILLLAIEEIRNLLDLKIFIDADDDIRILRRMERDIKERSRSFASVKDQYLETVKPMHDAFVAPSKKYADVIVPVGGHNQVALDMILAKLNEDLVKADAAHHQLYAKSPSK